jgi:hypothetical protein
MNNRSLPATLFSAFFLMLACSCGNIPLSREKETVLNPALDSVISRSGNESELKQVLAHYAQSPRDSLKWKAACFYILNLDGFCYYEGPLLDKYQEYLKLIRRDNAHGEYYLRSFNLLYGPFARERLEKKQDLREITAAQLEQNIDMAFKVWKELPWGKDISFDQFCELILPFRIGDEIPDYHRKEIYDQYYGFLDSAIRTGSSADVACGLINRELMRKSWQFSLRVPFLPHFPASQLIRYQAGSCKEMTDLALYTMRAVGIPVTIDFIPQWPYRSYGHEFNSVLGKGGKMLMFMGNEDDPDNHHKPLTKKGKVFRHTFARYPGSLAMLKGDKDLVPLFLNDPRIKDVTDEYVPTLDLPLTLSECPSLQPRFKKYAYLTVFDNNAWVPIHWGLVRDQDHQVLFTKMQGGIVYMPGYFDGLQIIPAGSPFILSEDGALTWLRPDKKKLIEKLTLSRVFPVSPDVWDTYHERSCSFQGSDSPDFSDAVNLYTIPTRPDPYWNEIKPDTPRAFRYVRYFGKGYTHMGEIEFYSSGRKLTGKPFGTKVGWYKDRTFDKAFDGNLYTFFDPAGAPGDTTYAGLDLGKKWRIDMIRFATPLTETNTNIVDGHSYELFYWEEGHWVSCGVQDGRDKTVHFGNIPSGALYYIQDQSQEIDCRIFTYDKGKINWW